MDSILIIGLFIGMRHAIEADHVAAVASLINGNQSLKQIVHQGTVWGLGHTITLLLFGSVVIFMDTVIPEQLAMLLELTVGIMLTGLGVDVLLRINRKKIHFHSHQHDNGVVHFHAHSHAGDITENNEPFNHRHHHHHRFPLRALLVGMMHGMAGSAAVIILALGTVNSFSEGITYILLFGFGSILGMALLSLAISIPMRLSARRLSWMHSSFQVVIGLTTLGLGMLIISKNISALM